MGTTELDGSRNDSNAAGRVEFGVDTFGDVTVGLDGVRLSHAQVLRNVVDQAVLADELGLDFFGIGEHHRDDFSVCQPEVVLAAIASRTQRIRLGSAVTVLSSDDPIRVFQRFSTLDAVSNGRAEVILGRGSFTESFPLFGFDLNDYNELFEEKLDLFSHLLTEKPITWSGQTRAPLMDQSVFPPTESGSLRTWIGVGGNQNSVVRAAKYGLPLMIAIIGGDPVAFAPIVDLYHRALAHFGQPTLPVGVHSPGYIGETDEQAREDLWPHYAAMHTRIGGERGWPPMTQAHFEQAARPPWRACASDQLNHRGDRGQDRLQPRPVPLRPQVQRRHHAPRTALRQHPPLRHHRRAPRP